MFADHLQLRGIFCPVLAAGVRGSKKGVKQLELLLRHWPANVWPVRKNVWLLEIANKRTRYVSVHVWRQAFAVGWRWAN